MDTWTVTGPGAAATREVKSGLMEEALNKLTGLRARTFDATLPATGTAPIMKVTTQFDEGKTEEASFARAGDDALAVRPDEAGAMRLDMAAIEETLQAFDTVLAPPPPATPAPVTQPAAPPPEKKP